MAAKNTFGRRIAKGGMELLALTAAATAIGYGTRIFLARNLSTEQFGLFYAAIGFITLFIALKDLGYSGALGKYIPEWIVNKKNDYINSAAWFGIAMQTAIGLALGGALFLGADFLAAEFFRNPSAGDVIRVLAVELMVVVVFLRHTFLGYQKIASYGSVDLVRNSLVLLFVVPLLSLGAFGIALSYLMASLIIQAILYYYFFRRMLRMFKPVLQFGGPERTAVKFGLISFASTLAGYAVSYADTLLLTGLKTLVDVGLYQAALPTSQLLLALTTPVVIVMQPAFSEMWARKQRETLTNGLRLALKIMIAVSIVPVLVVATWPDLIISLLFGPKFIGASGALQILVFGVLFNTLMLANAAVLAAIGRPGAYTKTYVVAAIASLGLNIALIPVLGITGASLASVFSYAIAFAISTVYVKRHMNVSAPWGALAKAIGAGVITLGAMALTKFFIVVNVFAEIAITVAAGFCVYVALLNIFRVFEVKDASDLENMGLPVPAIARRVLLRG